MGISLNSNFTVNVGLPLDDRIVVADLTARDAIAAGRRFDGLKVYVQSDSTSYQLRGGVDNSDWVEANGGGGGTYWYRELTSNVNSDGDIPELEVNGLTIGQDYLISMAAYLNRQVENEFSSTPIHDYNDGNGDFPSFRVSLSPWSVSDSVGFYELAGALTIETTFDFGYSFSPQLYFRGTGDGGCYWLPLDPSYIGDEIFVNMNYYHTTGANGTIYFRFIDSSGSTISNFFTQSVLTNTEQLASSSAIMPANAVGVMVAFEQTNTFRFYIEYLEFYTQSVVGTDVNTPADAVTQFGIVAVDNGIIKARAEALDTGGTDEAFYSSLGASTLFTAESTTLSLQGLGLNEWQTIQSGSSVIVEEK